MSLKKKLLRLGAIALVAYLALSAAAGIFLVDATLKVQRIPLGQHSPAYVAAQDHYRARIENVATTAADGAPLLGWFVPGSGPDTILLIHGFGDNREGVSGAFALLFLKHGYSVLMPDMRAHGQSGGQLATFGVLEAGDIRAWVTWLRQRQLRDGRAGGCIDGLGVSMGAGILLNSLPAEGRFCAAVAESSYASFRQIAYDRLGQRFGELGPIIGETIGRALVDCGFLYARLRYGVDLEKASPENAVAHERVPILLIHGLADDNIPPYHALMIARNNPRITLWRPAGVGHGSSITDVPEQYEQRVFSFLDSVQPAQRPATIAGAAGGGGVHAAAPAN